jgi:REP element-mobilizing transposase RayT
MDRTRLPNRQSIRLRGFDYSQTGAYFVTVCTTRRLCLLGDIEDVEERLSPVGQVVRLRWQNLPRHTPGLTIDAWVVMPNHLHGIVVLSGPTVIGAPGVHPLPGPKPGSLGAAIGGFKSAVSREIAAKHLSPVRPLWQPSYYERVIRNDQELDAIRRYIADNPLRWDDDPDHPRLHSPTIQRQRT